MPSTNRLNETFEEVRKELRIRGVKLNKDEFFNDIMEFVPKESIEALLEKYSPKEFLINERMEKDPDFKKQVILLMNSKDQNDKG